MSRKTRTGSRLFFIEFLIVLFFFLIVSTVCLKLFTRAHLITQRANALSHAQAAAASVAAAIEGTDGTPESVAAFFPEANVSSDKIMISYDRDFVPCSSDDASYFLTASLDTVNQEKASVISILDRSQNIVYELSVCFHEPLTRKEALL